MPMMMRDGVQTSVALNDARRQSAMDRCYTTWTSAIGGAVVFPSSTRGTS